MTKGGVTTPVTPKNRSRKNATKSPASGLSSSPQNVQVDPGNHQEEGPHAPDMMELLLDISSRLQATEFYKQFKEKADMEKLEADTTPPVIEPASQQPSIPGTLLHCQCTSGLSVKRWSA